MDAKGKPPRLRRLRWLRNIFLMTQPPLLASPQGGEKERLIPGGHQTRPLPVFVSTQFQSGTDKLGGPAMKNRWVFRFTTHAGQ